MKVTLITPSYHDGVWLILKAFHSLPPDFEDFPIQYWWAILEVSEEIIKNQVQL